MRVSIETEGKRKFCSLLYKSLFLRKSNAKNVVMHERGGGVFSQVLLMFRFRIDVPRLSVCAVRRGENKRNSGGKDNRERLMTRCSRKAKKGEAVLATAATEPDNPISAFHACLYIRRIWREREREEAHY